MIPSIFQVLFIRIKIWFFIGKNSFRSVHVFSVFYDSFIPQEIQFSVTKKSVRWVRDSCDFLCIFHSSGEFDFRSRKIGTISTWFLRFFNSQANSIFCHEKSIWSVRDSSDFYDFINHQKKSIFYHEKSVQSVRNSCDFLWIY